MPKRKTGVKRSVNKPDGGDCWLTQSVAYRAKLEIADKEKRAKETAKNKRAQVTAFKEAQELLDHVNTEQVEEEEVEVPIKKRKVGCCQTS